MIPAAARTESGLELRAEDLLGLRRYLRQPTGGRWHPDQRPAGFPGKRRGAGLETVDVRVFSEGDDPRYLDRNVTARTGVPHVRSFREERGATVILVADFRRDMLWGTRRALRSVVAAEALALGGWRAVEAGGRVGLYAFSGAGALFVAPRGRVSGIAAVAGGLAAAHEAALGTTEAGPVLVEALEAAARLAPTGATLVLASAFDDLGAEFGAFAGALGRAGRLKVVLVRDAFEVAPPPGIYPYGDARGHRRWGRISAGDVGETRDAELERLGIAVMSVEGAAGPEAMARVWEWFDGSGR